MPLGFDGKEGRVTDRQGKVVWSYLVKLKLKLKMMFSRVLSACSLML